MSLRILMVSDDYLPNPGGIATHVSELAEALARRGHRVDLWVGHKRQNGNGNGVPAPQSDDTELLRVLRNRAFSWSLPGYLGTAVGTARGLRRLLRAEPYDLVHWHSLFWESPAVRVGAASAPRVFTNHSSGFLRASRGGLGRRYMRLILSFADAVIAPSTELWERTVELDGDPERAFMIPNGVNVDAFAPAARDLGLLSSHGLSPEQPLVVVPRRLVHKNGVDLLLRAVGLGVGALERLQLLIIGDGPERAALEQLAASLGIAARVRFAGSKPRAEMLAHMCLADAGALPSRVEAVSIAGLEMMAAGLPLVGTAVGGIPQFLRAPETGRLVPGEDPEAMAAALRELFALSAAERRAIGAAARRHVVENFSTAACAERVEEVYRQVLAQAGAAAGSDAGSETRSAAPPPAHTDPAPG